MNVRRFSFPCRLYTIVDPLGLGNVLGSCSDIAREFLAGGARIVQLRAKNESSRDLLQVARALREVTVETGALFIVNDRVDVALASGADGVHLGQEDLPVEKARRILGRESIIGVSTHTVEQAIAAERSGVNYIGFGPVFATTTKVGPYQPRGLEGIRKVRASVNLPIVAIGGISEQTFLQVLEAGAHAAAMIGDLVLSEDRTQKIRRVLALASAPSLVPRE